MKILHKRGIFVLFMLLLSISLVSAETFKVDTKPIKDKITVKEAAKFDVKITNMDSVEHEYRIYSLNFPEWDVFTEPLENPIVLKIAANHSDSLELNVDPISVAMIGTYLLNINVQKDKTQEILKVPIKVSIFPKGAVIGGYVPDVVGRLLVPEQVDPRDGISLGIKLENQNMLDLENMTIVLDGVLIKRQLYSGIGPKETKTLEVNEKIDPLTSPGQYPMLLTIYVGEDPIITPVGKMLNIKEYSGLVDESTQTSFLKTVTKMTFASNNENTKNTFKTETTFFKDLFTSKWPRAKTIKEDGKYYNVWEAKLDPQTKTMEVTLSENYRTLFLILFLVIAMVFFYFYYRSPLVITKKTSSIGKKEGGISEVNVVLHIQNRAKGAINDIQIKDRLPHLTNIEKDITIGTLQPQKVIRHEQKGTFIKWVISSLNPGEERVINYKVKASLSILGDFNLPASTAAFVYGGKTMSTSSNRLNVTS